MTTSATPTGAELSVAHLWKVFAVDKMTDDAAAAKFFAAYPAIATQWMAGTGVK